ncbi:MAG: hypothetical protein JSR78_07470 [Proteobacteria bacterium]|nr:hypothetical protein [Pseudomonadota bacterium]
MEDDPANLGYALRSGILCALITCMVESSVIYVTPAEWLFIVTHLTTSTLIVFWVVFITRFSGSDILWEIGANYPDLTHQASLHAKLEDIQEAIADLDRSITSKGARKRNT